MCLCNLWTTQFFFGGPFWRVLKHYHPLLHVRFETSHDDMKLQMILKTGLIKPSTRTWEGELTHTPQS